MNSPRLIHIGIRAWHIVCSFFLFAIQYIVIVFEFVRLTSATIWIKSVSSTKTGSFELKQEKFYKMLEESTHFQAFFDAYGVSLRCKHTELIIYTGSWVTIQLHHHVKLIDSPGKVLPKDSHGLFPLTLSNHPFSHIFCRPWIRMRVSIKQNCHCSNICCTRKKWKTFDDINLCTEFYEVLKIVLLLHAYLIEWWNSMIMINIYIQILSFPYRSIDQPNKQGSKCVDCENQSLLMRIFFAYFARTKVNKSIVVFSLFYVLQTQLQHNKVWYVLNLTLWSQNRRRTCILCRQNAKSCIHVKAW